MKQEVHRESPPFTDEDLIYVVDRRKDQYTFPIHTHDVYELNFTIGGKGVQRIVGDNIENIDNYDLVLIDGDTLEHGWFNTNNVYINSVREITIQFSKSLISENLLNKRQFASIKQMFVNSKKGISFSLNTILKVKPFILSLTTEENGFRVIIDLLNLLYELSNATDSKILASNTYANTSEEKCEDGRLAIVLDYIHRNYDKNIHLHDVASMINMSDAGFSRYFKNIMGGVNLTMYIIQYRISKAAWMIIHTDKTISEICYATGFDSLSYFHRQFKVIKGYTPNEFRKLFSIKHTIL